MADSSDFIDDISLNTIIGPGCFIDGNVSLPGFLTIDGDVNGNIDTSGRIILKEKARIRGNVRARSVIVGGMVQGDIIAPESVEVLSTGLVWGSILTKKIRVEENVLIHGFCFAVNDSDEFEKAEKEYKNRQGLAASALSGLL